MQTGNQKFCGSERGTVCLENALVLPILFLLLIAGSDFLRFWFTYLGAEHCLEETANWAGLGEVEPGLTRTESIKTYFLKRAEAYHLTLAPENLQICNSNDPSPCANESAGAPRSDFRISVQFPAKLALLNTVLMVNLEAHGHNERGQ